VFLGLFVAPLWMARKISGEAGKSPHEIILSFPSQPVGMRVSLIAARHA
jgi:hypothetical protein